MQAAVVDLLSEKGKFSREQSFVLAEAMDMTIEKAQLVTVPILDARFAAVDARFATVNARIDSLEAKFEKLEAKMQQWAVRIVIAVLLGQAALGPIGLSALDALRRALSTVVP
jgi:hypothetical protein